MSSLVQIHRPAPRWSTVGATVLGSAFTLARAALGWPMRVHANRKLLNQMSEMSAYELADIGLAPADLRDTAALSLGTEVGHFLSSRATERRRAQNSRRS